MTNQEYEKKLQELEAEVEKLQELQAEIDELKAFKPTEYKRWRAREGDEYSFLSGSWYIGRSTEQADTVDDYRYNTGNYFKTEKEAEQHKAYLLALQTIKDDAEGWIPDWEDKDEEKWFTYYDHEYKVPGTDKNSLIQFPGMIYFQAEKKLRHSLITHEAEWLTVLGVEQ